MRVLTEPRPRNLLACAVLVAALPLGGCGASPPSKRPPLASMEEPLLHAAWPDDEAERLSLAAGGFTGVVAADARMTLEELAGAPAGLRVASVVENSPADAVGIEVDDLLIEARLGDEPWMPLAYVSDWRGLELVGVEGAELEVLVDRAGYRRRVRLVLEDRVRPADAPQERRIREEERVGLVLRSPTEVESRRAGLAPGAGAVVVGLALESPWRRAGVTFGDLVVALDGEPVRDLAEVVQAIERASAGLELDLARGEERITVEAPVTRRAQVLSSFSIPLLFSYEERRGRTSLSMALGLFDYESTEAAWELVLGWFLVSFSGGDSDRLKEVDG